MKGDFDKRELYLILFHIKFVIIERSLMQNISPFTNSFILTDSLELRFLKKIQ